MSEDSHPHSHRRDFVLALAIGGAAAAIPLVSRADEPEKTEEPPRPRSEVDARMDLILARYGKSLDEEARKSVRAEVESIVRRAETLRKFPLTNGDEPFPVFTPYRASLA
jgi:hypothetical protein